MNIAAEIDYYGSSVAVFDPQKVLERLSEAFPMVTIDYQDLAQNEVDSLIDFLDTNKTPEPRRGHMLRQIQGKASRIGPVYSFSLDVPEQGILSGKAGRYHVTFFFERSLNSAIEQAIIRFLQSLQLGTIRSDTETLYFRMPHPEYPEYWVLGTDLPSPTQL